MEFKDILRTKAAQSTKVDRSADINSISAKLAQVINHKPSARYIRQRRVRGKRTYSAGITGLALYRKRGMIAVNQKIEIGYMAGDFEKNLSTVVCSYNVVRVPRIIKAR